MIVRVAPPEHYAWIAERAQIEIRQSFRAIEAVTVDGRILGMVGFDGWTQNSACMHVALERPSAARHLIRPAFGIVFVEFAKGVLVAQVRGDNARSLLLCLHMGFTETARIRNGWAKGTDIVLFVMRREECRWIGETQRKAA